MRRNDRTGAPRDPWRRRFVLGTAALAAGGLAGCKQVMQRWLTRHDNSVFSPTSYSFEDTDACVLTAEAIEGPYFIDGTPVRRDIREDKPGQDLRLGLKLVEADGCTPVAGALVAIWHCDALGWYSGHPDMSPDELPAVAPGQRPPTGEGRFLRGVQATDANGLVEFLTIFPGWYLPRVEHVHVKVAIDERQLLTSQFYFPQEWIDEVQRQAPYRERGPSPVTNRNDFVIHESGGADGGWLRMSRDGDTWVGTLTLGLPPIA